MKWYSTYWFFFVCIFVFSGQIYADVVGSLTSVLVPAFTLFPENPVLFDNEIIGFTWMRNGFELENSDTECTFSAAFPVSSVLTLNGGTLFLERDFYLKNEINWNSGGYIIGNGAVCVELGEAVTAFPSDSKTFQDVKILFHHDITLSSTITFSGDCALIGNGHTLYVESGGAIEVAADSSLELSDLELDGMGSSNLYCVDNDGIIILNDMRMVLSDDYLFDTGKILFMGDVELVGDENNFFELSSKYTSTVAANTSLHVLGGLDFKLGIQDEPTTQKPIYFTNNTSIVRFDNSNLLIANSGVQLLGGTIELDHKVILDFDSTSTANGLIVGDGISADNDMFFQFNAGAFVEYNSGHVLLQNLMSAPIQAAAHKSSRLFRGEGSHLFVDQDLLFPPLTVELESNLVPPLQQGTGKILSYDNTKIIFPGSEFDLTGTQNGTFAYLLANGGNLFSSRGTFPLGLVIDGTGNEIRGSGNIGGPIIFSDPTADLTIGIQGDLDSSISLNGGTLIADGDLAMATGGSIAGPGRVCLDGNSFSLASIQSTWNTSLLFEGTDGVIDLENKLSLVETVTLSGTIKINGNGNIISLSNNGKIIIDDGADVTFKDVTLDGIQDGNFACLSDDSCITFDNVFFVQSGNYSFNTGSFAIENHTTVRGTYTFNYMSSRTSTVNSAADFCFTGGNHFCIGRYNPGNGVEPLAFVDKNSQLTLDGASFVITSSGFNATKGTITVAQEIFLDIKSTGTNYGLILGDGISSDNDMQVKIRSGALVRHVDGVLVYNNVESDAIQGLSSESSFARTPNSVIHIAKSLTLPEIRLKVDTLTAPPVQFGDNATLDYVDTNVVLPLMDIDITGRQQQSDVYALEGGTDSIFISRGGLLLGTMVSDAGNKILGNGNIVGPVTFLSDTAELILGIDGELQTSPMLNGGKIILSAPLHLANNIKTANDGAIDLDSFSLQLGRQDFTWSSAISWDGDNGSISINSTLSLVDTWTFNGDVVINGNGNVLELGNTGEIVIADGASVTFRNVLIKGVSGNNIRCVTDNSSIQFDTVSLLQEGNYTFDMGSISFLNNVSLIGSYTFNYESSYTSTIERYSELLVTDGSWFYIGRADADSGIEPLYFMDDSSTLKLDRCSFIITSSGMQCTNGTIEVNRNVFFDIQGTTTTQGFILGNGTTANDFILRLNASAQVDRGSGYMVYNNGSPDKFTAVSAESRLIRNADSKFYLATDLNLPTFTVQITTMSAHPIEKAAGVTLQHDAVILEFPQGSVITSGRQANTMTHSLNGNEKITVLEGAFPLPVVISGTGNSISGNGDMDQIVTYLSPTADLTVGLKGSFLGNVTLNNGTLYLSDHMNLGNGILINGPGIVDFDGYALKLGRNTISWPTSMSWTGNGGGLTLRSGLTLASTWAFDGDCIINGNDHLLDLGALGEITIAAGASLELRNMRIKNLRNSNIKCLGDDASLILNEVIWQQDGDFTFDTGSIKFTNQVDFIGSYTFNYTSKRTSTIDEKSELNVGFRMNMNVGRYSASTSLEPIAFSDETSVLRLDNCGLFISQHGATFTKGNFICEREVILEIDSTGTANGLTFGDGTSSGDIIFELSPGTSVRLLKGHLNLNFDSGDSVKSRSQSARIDRKDGTVLTLQSDVTLQDLTLEADSLAVLNVDAGKTLTYDNCIIGYETGAFDITGSRINYYSNMLSGNDSIFLRRGDLVTYSIIAGTGNAIRGNGSMSGGIVMNPGAELTYNLSGPVLTDISLNSAQLFLTGDLTLGRGTVISTGGTVEMGNNQVNLGTQEITWPSAIYWDGTNASILLNALTHLSAVWTFSGDCTIDGNGNTLELVSGGNIIVEQGSKLRFKDVIVKGISGNNIRCLDDFGTIECDNVNWIQSDDYTFDTGAMIYKNDVQMTALNTKFIYQSSQTSTILAESRLKLDEKFTFSYDPGIISQDLIEFIDNTSEFHLRGATLYATVTGMNLYKGNMTVKGDAEIATEIREISEDEIIDIGIMIGSGIEEDDMEVFVNVGSSLNLTGGTIIYNNVNQSSLKMGNAISNISVDVDTTFDIRQTIDLGIGRLVFKKGSALFIPSDKSILGSVILEKT